MEDTHRNRRCRRSIRVIRRSSGFFTDTYVPSLQVEEPEATPDNEEDFTYGSVWVENNCTENSSNKQVVNHAGVQIPSAEVGDSSECLPKQDMFLAVNSYTELANKFLDSHNAGVSEESLTQCASRIDTNSCRDSSNMRSEIVRKGDSCNQRMSQSVFDMDFDGKLQQHIDSSCASANTITNNLHENVDHNKDIFLVKDNVSPLHTTLNTFSTLIDTMFDKSVSNDGKVSEYTKQIKTAAFENTKDVLKDDFETCNTNIKSSLSNKEVRNNFKTKIETPDLLTNSTRSRKERRKSESQLIKQDISKCLDYEPKKRKRLSLKTARTTILEEREHNVENHVDKDIELKQNTDMVCESFKESNNNMVYVTSKSCSSELENIQLVENQDDLGFMDFEINEEMLTDFDVENCCPQKAAEKKSKQSKAKSTRRSSRYFFLHEMPLSDYSLESISAVPQQPTPDNNSGTPKFTESYNEKSRQNIPDEHLGTAKKPWSPEFLKSCNEDNEQNTPDEHSDTQGKAWCLEDDSQSLAIDSTLLNVAFIDDVLEDLANLCVNEKACTEITGLPLQARQRSDDKKHSGSCQTRVSTSVVPKGTDANKDCKEVDCHYVDKDCIEIDCQDVNNPLSCMRDALDSHENLSNNTDGKCNKGRSEFDCKSGDNNFKNVVNDEENGQSLLDFMFSSAVDVDMDDIQSQLQVNSESKVCTRLRRNRKSWGICQQTDSDKEKKPPRQVIRPNKTEKQISQTSVSDNSQFSTSVDNASVTAQPNNNEAFSEVNKYSSSDEDIDVSPGLLCLYTNKNFVMPQPKSWETIKESPKSKQQLFSKQQRKRFLEFENSLTLAKLQRRHKKALNVYKKIVQKPVPITDEEFERKMLDTQLLLEST